MGVYHRHVMGDGYQLNVLLFKGAVFAGLMICAFEFILNNLRVAVVHGAGAVVCAAGHHGGASCRPSIRAVQTQAGHVLVWHCGGRLAGGY